MEAKSLSDEDRERCIEEGRQAAIQKANPFACPYISDNSDQRFSLWIEGYRLGQTEAKNLTSIVSGQAPVILDEPQNLNSR
jgi:ribosome modulation factor